MDLWYSSCIVSRETGKWFALLSTRKNWFRVNLKPQSLKQNAGLGEITQVRASGGGGQRARSDGKSWLRCWKRNLWRSTPLKAQPTGQQCWRQWVWEHSQVWNLLVKRWFRWQGRRIPIRSRRKLAARGICFREIIPFTPQYTKKYDFHRGHYIINPKAVPQVIKRNGSPRNGVKIPVK